MPTRVPTGSGPLPPTGVGMAGPDEAEMFVGQELCGYLIQRKLAEGGMGVVYEGQHIKIGRRGAIKVLKVEFCRNEEVVERFYQEARAVNSIRHENIVDIYDFGRDPHGRVFFVMEYLEGEPLSARLRRGALAWPEAFTILEQTLRALNAAHDKGFVHRDLKPDNIWLKYVEGRIEVKLLDFGIAKLVGTESPQEKLTKTGSVIGTPHYMSPEQINGSAKVDHRTDIYAMGVITYEMFAGVTPFVGDTLQAIMTGHLFTEPPRLAALPPNLGVPAPIAEIVDRMLVKDAAGRYDSATDVLSDLHDVNQNQRPANAETLNRTRPARGATQVLRPVAPPRKSKLGVVLAGGLGVAAIVGGIAVWQSRQTPEAPPPVVVATGPGSLKTPPPAPPEPPVIDKVAAGKNARSLLHDGVQHAEPPIRVQSVDTVRGVKDTESIDLLSKRLELDQDDLVAAHIADALSALGAASAIPVLGKLETAASPQRKPWYAGALARLGDRNAVKRLQTYARDKDLAVSVKAGLVLGEVSKPGDKTAIATLKAIGAAMAKTPTDDPYAGMKVLEKLVALRDQAARETLHALLEQPDEGARLEAARTLAKLGDEAGKKPLQDIAANAKSPNQLAAAVALISLGEYSGLPLITSKLDDKDTTNRAVAASALGDMADAENLAALIKLTSEKEWKVRVAAAGAILAIVGIDKKLLAQASVDWTQSALDSTDTAVRKSAASVLADIPDQKAAAKLLAQAFEDKDVKVRAEAANSARRMKTSEAAQNVMAAVAKESDPVVKVAQVKALGEIGKPEARDMLAQLSTDPGPLGVFAAGSLIGVGDASGATKLEEAIAAAKPAVLRMAAVEAASSVASSFATSPKSAVVVVPTLKTGLRDKVFDIQFAAAEGLTLFMEEKAESAKILQQALKTNKNPSVIGRAMAALTRIGENIDGAAQSPSQLIDSPDPKQRLAAVPVVRALPVADGVPLLRRLIADVDQEVRRTAVDAIEGVATKDREQAIKMYKPLVNDADPFVRAKASGQLSRLVEEIPVAVTTPPPPPAAPATPAAPVDPAIQIASDEAASAASDVTTEAAALDGVVADIGKLIDSKVQDDAALDQMAQYVRAVEEAQTKMDAAAKRSDDAAKRAATAGGAKPADESAKLIREAGERAKATRIAMADSRTKAASAKKRAQEFMTREGHTVEELVSRAAGAINVGKFAEAEQLLTKATTLARKTGEKAPEIDYRRADLHWKMSTASSDPATKVRLRKQAKDEFQRFVKTNSGRLAKSANQTLADIAEEEQQP